MFGLKKKNPYFEKIVGKIAVESSICTGEKLIGFKNTTTGKLERAVVVRNTQDIYDFCKQYNISKAELPPECKNLFKC